MKLLLDTNVLLWWLENHPRLGASARKAVIAAEIIYVSAASVWEIAIKTSRGKLQFAGDLEKQISLNGFRSLPISSSHAWAAGQLPWHHTDPFDRMLVAQAAAESLTLVTGDRILAAYGIPALFT